MNARPLVFGALVFCLLGLWPGGVSARSGAGEAVYLGPSCHWRLFEAPKPLSAATLAQEPFDGKLYNQTPRRHLNFGQDNRAYLIRCPLGGQPIEPIFRIGWKVYQVSVFIFNPDQAQLSELPPLERAGWAHEFRLPANLPPNTQLVVLARARPEDSLILHLSLWPLEALEQEQRSYQILSALGYGAVGVMILFNLIIYLSLRDSIYLLYSAYLAATIPYFLAPDGLGITYLWPAEVNTGIGYQAALFFLCTISLFARRLLDLREHSPRLDNVVLYTAGAVGLGFLSSFVLPLWWTTFLTANFGPLVPLLLLGAGVVSLRHRRRTALLYLGAWSAYLAALILQGMIMTGAPWPDISLIDWSLVSKLAATIEVTLFSFALADRYRQIRSRALDISRENLKLTRNHAAELEATVAQRTKELIEANQTKDKFFSIISHDLRGPMGSLSVLFNEVFKPGTLIDEETHRTIASTTKSTYQLLENLLVWARNQKGEIEFHPSEFSVSHLIELNLALFRSPAQQKDIQLSAHWDKNYRALADFEMANTILRNLINNALKFTPKGGKVELKVTTQGDWLAFEVCDNGPGLGPELRASLFDLKSKVDSSPKASSEQGTGLGLVLCGEFVRRHGGEISVQSEPGQGACFRFTLPQTDRGEATEPGSNDGLRFLLVDDDELHLQTSSQALRRLSVWFITATSGGEAVEQFRLDPFDVVLMDINLPDLNGLKAAEQIRALAQDQQPTLIALTSHSKTEVEKMGPTARFDGYLNKPLQANQLSALLDSLRNQKAE